VLSEPAGPVSRFCNQNRDEAGETTSETTIESDGADRVSAGKPSVERPESETGMSLVQD
jgi:hypothetical protein